MELLEPPYSSIYKLLKEVLFIAIPMHYRLSAVANLLNLNTIQYVAKIGQNAQDVFYEIHTFETKAIEKSLENELKKSNRTLKQFGDNLIASWMIEDAIKEYYEAQGRTVFLNGTDKEREILVSNKVSAAPDMYLSAPGQDKPICYMEITNCYSDFCQKNNSLDLRFSKLDHLIAKSKTIPTGIILVDLHAGEMILINITENTPYEDTPAFAVGKPSKRISLKNSRRIPLSDLVAHELQFA